MGREKKDEDRRVELHMYVSNVHTYLCIYIFMRIACPSRRT